MADWDDEDFEPPSVHEPAMRSDQWQGEDEDDEIKDNWDDEDDENKDEVEAAPAKNPESGEPKLSKKKALAKKLKEKEEAAEARRLAAAEAAKTPEEILADKLRAQQLAQESDLEVARDTFGVSADDPDKMTIDSCNPSTKEDFTNLEEMLSEKFSKFESSPHYHSFLEIFFRNSCLSLDAESLKKIISSLNVLHAEKAKQERQKKGGKKTNKAKLVGGTKGGTKDDLADYSMYDELGDFM